jgi:SAM-dependent methyltransferase
MLSFEQQRNRLEEVKRHAVRSILPSWHHVTAPYLSEITGFGAYSVGRTIMRFCTSIGLTPAHSRVLIVGAKGGRDYHWFKGFGHSVDTLDLGDHPWGRTDYVGDACRAETWDRIPVKYDLVIMCEVLEHLPEDFAALVHARTVLKNDGHLFLSVPYAHDQEPTHVRAYTPTTLTRLLKLAGFETVCQVARPGLLESTVLTPMANSAIALLAISPELGGKVLCRLLEFEYALNERTRGLYARFGRSPVKGVMVGARLQGAPTQNYVAMNYETFIARTDSR